MKHWSETDVRFMLLAFQQAYAAFEANEVPIGAVVTVNNQLITQAHNGVEQLRDVTAHAEMVALTGAMAHFQAKYLPECTLYVTLEPCPMCAGAIRWAQVKRVVYAADDPKTGYRRFNPLLIPSQIVVESGLMAEESAALLRAFFQARRKIKQA